MVKIEVELERLVSSYLPERKHDFEWFLYEHKRLVELKNQVVEANKSEFPEVVASDVDYAIREYNRCNGE